MPSLPTILATIADLEAQREALIRSVSREYILPQGYKLVVALKVRDGQVVPHLDLLPNHPVEKIPFAVLREFAIKRERIEEWIAGTINNLPAP